MIDTTNPLGTEQNTSDCGAGLPLELQSYPVTVPEVKVNSVNGKTGDVVLTTDDVEEGGRKYLTEQGVRNSLSASDPISFDKNIGIISHKDSLVIPGVYGSDTQYPKITVDSKGHITGVTLGDLPVPEALGSNLSAIETLAGLGYLSRTGTNTWVFKAITGTSGRTNVTEAQGTNVVKIDLATVGTAGAYGSSNKVPKITVDAYGRVTGIELITIAAPPAPDVPSLGNLPNVDDSADVAQNGMTLVYVDGQWIPQSPVQTPVTPKSTPTVTLQATGTDKHTIQADVNITEILNRINNTPSLKSLFCEIAASCPVTVTTWIADSTICERSNMFSVSKTINNLYSPMMVTYDAPTGKAFVTDADNADGKGNIAWFNPLTATLSSDLTYSAKVAQSNIYSHIADPEKRKIYLAGKNTGGLIVYDIPTDSISTIPYGTDGIDFNRINVVRIGNNIYCSDSVAHTLVRIDRNTLVVSAIIDLATVPSSERFAMGGYLIAGNDKEIYVCAGSGSSISTIGVYSTDFSTLIDEVILPGVALWTDNKYWASVFYDATSQHLYVGDPGSNQTFTIDTVTHEVITSQTFNNRRGKSNATFNWVVNPTTNELMKIVNAMDTPYDASVKSSLYIEDRATFGTLQSFIDISVSQITSVDNSAMIAGSDAGLPGWAGGTNQDGKITFFDSTLTGDNTTRLLTLTLKEMSGSQPTGKTKANSIDDPDYIAPITDATACPVNTDLSCVQQVITTTNIPFMYYEFDLPQTVLANGAVSKLKMSAFDIAASAVVGTPQVIDKGTHSFVSGVISDVPAGSVVNLQVEYLDAADTVLKTCNQ